MASNLPRAPEHVFLRNAGLGRDWRGRSYCLRCNLPESSASHRAAPQYEVDRLRIAAGERPEAD